MECKRLPHQKREKKKYTYDVHESVIIFQCYPKNNIKDKHQGILYSEGICQIGYDVWRDLHYTDTSSHPVLFFPTLGELKKEYVICNKKGKKVEKTRRIIKC